MNQNPAPQKPDYDYMFRIKVFVVIVSFVIIVIDIPLTSVLLIGALLASLVLVLPKLVNLVRQTQKTHTHTYRILALVLGLLIGAVSIITRETIVISVGLIALSLGLIGIGLGLKET